MRSGFISRSDQAYKSLREAVTTYATLVNIKTAHVGYTQRLISSYEKLSHLSYKLIIGLLVSGYAVSEVDHVSLW